MKITTKFADSDEERLPSRADHCRGTGRGVCRHGLPAGQGRAVAERNELPTRDTPQLQDVVRASQGTLQNLDVLVKQLNDIVAFIQNGQGSIGKIIYDPSLFNRANDAVTQLQQIIPRSTLRRRHHR